VAELREFLDYGGGGCSNPRIDQHAVEVHEVQEDFEFHFEYPPLNHLISSPILIQYLKHSIFLAIHPFPAV